MSQPSSRVPILMYHRIGDPPPGALVPGHYVAEARFKAHLRALQRTGFEAVTMERMEKGLVHGGPLPPKPIVVSFDDGYKHLATRAFPHLTKHRVPAIVFAVAGLTGGTNEWDSAKGDAKEELLSWDDLRQAVADGFEVGSHTLTHADLVAIGPERARSEVWDSRARLESELAQPVLFFCYPYGKHNEDVIRLVREAGYIGACSTLKGLNSTDTNPFVWRRVNVRRDTWTPVLFWKILRASRVRSTGL